MESVLIVDDDRDICRLLEDVLGSHGYKVVAADNAADALNEFRKRPDLVLLDIRLHFTDGFELLRKLKEMDATVTVIMLTGYGDVKGAVRAIKLGAFDYITKPFDMEELLLAIRKALETRRLTEEVALQRKRLCQETESVRGDSQAIKQVLSQVRIVAPTNMSVVIQGESGTGKELIARMIHELSPRREKPFVAIDCGALPETLAESELLGHEKGAFTGADSRKEGHFELANGGTLFLDEITNLKESLQVKFLRVIQERKVRRLGCKREIEVDVRIIVATNINFREEVERKKFRSDLYHRLNEFTIVVPPLRERTEDIPALAFHFLKEANLEFGKEVKGFSDEVTRFFLSYNWPGNVRELKNTVIRAALLTSSDYITYENLLPESIKDYVGINREVQLDGKTPLGDLIKSVTTGLERDVIKKALVMASNNKTRAARLLKIDRITLYNKLKSLGIKS